jgi:hypothetical protein
MRGTFNAFASLSTLPLNAGCHNFEEPAYGSAQVHVLSPTDSMNPFASMASTSDTGWTQWLASQSTLIPRDELSMPECAHYDKCGAMKPADASAGWITFVLPSHMPLGMIFVCCCCGKECVQQVFLDTNAEFWFDGKQMDSSKFQVWPNGKCLRLQDKFSGTISNSQGHLYLSVKFNTALSGGTKGISHVVAM